MKHRGNLWKWRNRIALSLLLGAVSFTACRGSDNIPDTQSATDQQKAYQIEKGIDDQLRIMGLYELRVKNSCMLIKEAEPPKTEAEQREMDDAAQKTGMAGCFLWLARHAPKPKGYPPTDGLIFKDPKMTPQECIGHCRAFALEMMEQQRLFGDQCPKTPDVQTAPSASLRNAVSSADTKSQKRKIAKILAALLAYLGLVIPGMIMNPQSSDFASLFGTLLGSLDALEGLGLQALAAQARMGGFAGAAVAESFELARIYRTSTVAGERACITATRLVISLVPDAIIFAASTIVMGTVIDAAIAGAAIVGPIAAGAMSVAAAALITYGISAAATAVKTQATRALNIFIEK